MFHIKSQSQGINLKKDTELLDNAYGHYKARLPSSPPLVYGVIYTLASVFAIYWLYDLRSKLYNSVDARGTVGVLEGKYC